MKANIPRVPPQRDNDTYRVLDALKQNVEDITGQRGNGKIEALASTATTADLIAKVNEIIARLQS